MRNRISSLMALALVFSGCSKIAQRQLDNAGSTASQTATRAGESVVSPSFPAGFANANSSQAKSTGTNAPATDGAVLARTSASKDGPLLETETAKSAEAAMQRKVIQNANLTIEMTSPGDGQRKIAAIAESHGGFVVTSDFDRQTREDRPRPGTTVTIVARVPASQFNVVVEEVRHVGGDGSQVRQEKISGQDVTEEYIDVEARIKTKKALEAQFLEIMKQAHRVTDALEVQAEIANVRTDIERMEGRRRFLDNQSSLSTISVTLQPPALFVSTSSFSYNARQAFSDGFDEAEGITLFLIRLLTAMVPIVILVILPIGVFVRFLIRRADRLRLARKIAEEPEIAPTG